VHSEAWASLLHAAGTWRAKVALMGNASEVSVQTFGLAAPNLLGVGAARGRGLLRRATHERYAFSQVLQLISAILLVVCQRCASSSRT